MGEDRLSADQIADEIESREFDRAPDGFDEAQVRAFLREVSARVRALDARAEPTEPDSEGDERAEALFARLRETKADEPPPPPRTPRPEPARESDEAEPPAEEPVAEQPVAEQEAPEDESEAVESAAPDDAEPPPALTEGDRARARRDAMIASVVPDLLRSSKRLLQDEQNLLLDAARRSRGRIDPTRLLPEPVHHRDAWAALLGPGIDQAYGAGRSGARRSRRATNAPERVVNELTAAVLAPLRDRLVGTMKSVVAEGPYDSPAELHRAMAGAIGARYREWRGTELESRLADALAAAFARGAYDGAPSGAQLEWVTDAPGRCPDCDDNALEPTTKGRAFPTGQTHPPAHPGCRCLVIPAASGGD